MTRFVLFLAVLNRMNFSSLAMLDCMPFSLRGVKFCLVINLTVIVMLSVFALFAA